MRWRHSFLATFALLLGLLPFHSSAQGLDSGSGFVRGESGPWGSLEFRATYLEAPEELSRLLPLPSQQVEWLFRDVEGEQVDIWLTQCGFPLELYPRMIEQEWIYGRGEDVVIYPPKELVLEMAPETRRRLYSLLGQWKENYFYYKPVVIQDVNLSRWFQGSGLSASLLQRIAQLMYTEGDTMLFSDVALLLNYVQHGEEERKLAKALTRCRNLEVRLRLGDESDMESMQRYWSAHGWNHAVEPVLEALMRSVSEQEQVLDVIHLLPQFARNRVGRYPTIEDGLSGRLPDGFWSALNFFKTISVDLYRDSVGLDGYLRSKYQQVDGPFQLGDVLLLVDAEDREAYHACNYVAADIVFTKNHADALTPWTLMTIDDLMDHHQRGKPSFISAWRRNAE